ncbi:MAG: helix-hairpin-helix domain-containing protein [Planctomycetia bacterium]|nr:helix-hairpin-helix domain-containing protein [Planctomycetia bacterium]
MPWPDKTRWPPLTLRRRDQAVIAAGVIVLLAYLAVRWWIWPGGFVEAERQAPAPAKFQVDINTAAWPEIAQLPEIGEALAKRIVASREKDGPFKTHDDLDRVSGIGPKTVEKLRPYLLPIK